MTRPRSCPACDDLATRRPPYDLRHSHEYGDVRRSTAVRGPVTEHRGSTRVRCGRHDSAVAGDVWISVTSLGGVALGGALSFFVQHATQRSAERMEQQRQLTLLSETRRADRLARVERFVEIAAEAERCAFSRPTQWEEGDPWQVKAQAVMNRLWVSERMIRLLFPLPVHDAARAYFLDLNLVVWQGLADGENVRDYLEANRLAFLDTARAAVE